MNYSLKWPALLVCATLAALAGCDGSTKADGEGGRAALVSVDLGRIVDVYAYRRTAGGSADRRRRAERTIDLVQRNVFISAGVESQTLFDPAGSEIPSANYEFLPFDKSVGHEELLILWDDTAGGAEQQKFQTALANAQAGFGVVPASYRGQNTLTRPIPIVPRNAAVRLRFSKPLGVDDAFFAVNPGVIQLLEFKGNPDLVNPADAFRVLPYRAVVNDDNIVLDTTILGAEGAATTTSGLPLSADSVTANIRVAIPARGEVNPIFYVQEDAIAELNGVDSAGRNSVIRDFRSGNLADGVAGRLREPEAPMIVTSLAMGITAVDTVNNILTLNKRGQFVPVRGRYPFVDGPLNAQGLPLGPLAAPLARPLQVGDIIQQTINVELQPGVFESLTLRAEVLQNLAIGTSLSDPVLGLALNPLPSDSGQGELETSVQVRVASVFAGVASNGVRQRFSSNGTVNGQDCLLRARYYEEVPFSGAGGDLTDRAWRNLFVRIEPKPSIPAANVLPNSSVAVEFTKPMDLDQVDATKNLLVTNRPTSAESFDAQMTAPKRATTRVVPTRLSDLLGDGTVLRLQPPKGFFHAAGVAESYAFHVRLGTAGVTDLAGNALDIYDNPSNPQGSWSVDFSLAAAASANNVGWHVFLFEAEDEDGTLPGSVDLFGQYRLENGSLIGASGVRFGRSADRHSLATISRINRGECWDPRNPTLAGVPPVPTPATGNSLVLPTNPVDQAGLPHPGLLYWNQRMIDSIGPNPTPAPVVFEYWQTLPQPVGRVSEPFKPQGSRMQMRYIEDDFSLSYRQPSDLGLDVDQLYWSPFNKETVLYDVFDRFSMSLSHARRRPDEFWFIIFPAPQPATPPQCVLGCESMNSALSVVFADNVLEGTSPVPVFEDAVYTVNPNQAFRTTDDEIYVPFPRFDRTYTWRDSRLVTVDANGVVIGLGGAQEPGALPPNNDITANIDSPWIQSVPLDTTVNPPVPDPEFFASGASIYVQDPADFVGLNQRDHDPIALPLLVDFKMFADDAANGIASGSNGFQVATLGPPTYGFPGAAGGYYDRVGSGCGAARPPWPSVRAHTSGGFDLLSPQVPIIVDPANTQTALGGNLKDAGLGAAATGLFTAPARDGMLHWARADFVRKVSTMTFGFFDTLQPQRAQPVDEAGAVLPAENGIPNLLAVNPDLRINDLVVQLDPPQVRQPAGTSVVVEMRGADDFVNSNTLYNPSFAGQNPSDAFNTRGNLLNANYACEAYRYSTANVIGAPRVAANGLTRYVTEDQIALIRNSASNLLPRFINLRVVMTNNVDVTPSLSPSLRSMSIVYSMTPQ